MNSSKCEFDIELMDIIKAESGLGLQLDTDSVDSDELALSADQSNRVNTNNENKTNNTNNDHLSQYYSSFGTNANQVFACIYSTDCQQTERYENQMIDHLRHHLAKDNNNSKTSSFGTVESKANLAFNDNELILPNNDFMDENMFESNDNNSSKTASDWMDANGANTCMQSSAETNSQLELYIGVRVVDGKERLFCKWPECRFEANQSNQKNCLTRHVLNKHLNGKQTNATNQTNPLEAIDAYDETKYWEKLLNTNNKNWLQKASSAQTSKSASEGQPTLESLASLQALVSLASAGADQALGKPPVLTPFTLDQTFLPSTSQTLIDDKQWFERMTSMASLQAFGSPNGLRNLMANNILNDSSLDGERDLLMGTSSGNTCFVMENNLIGKNHLNISNNEENILLSCKGLASMSKVRDYYESQVLNGEKIFYCKWRSETGQLCPFKTKKSQKIAQHINLTHIGVEFRCNKPNCYKVFKNPNTYREHQKNHICGFGIFGYGSKGVIGVCRNESLNQYRERVIIDSKKFYKCVWSGGSGGVQCNAITRYHMAMKRHIHNHVCPYRVNLKLKQNQDVINDIKSETWNLDLGLGSIASTSGPPSGGGQSSQQSQPNNSQQSAKSGLTIKKSYQCRRTKCRASFSNNADLLKHENILCKFKFKHSFNNHFIANNKSTVGSKAPPIKPKQEMDGSGDGLRPSCMKANEQIMRKPIVPQLLNGNRLEKALNGMADRANGSIGSIRRMAQIEKYFSTKVMNGVNYHLCIYNDCKFTNKILDKTIDHIQTAHFGLDSQLNNAYNISTNLVQNSAKRVLSLTESPETDSSKENSSKKFKPMDMSVSSSSADSEPAMDRSANQKSATIEHNFSKHTINGEILYFCDQNDCEFYTKNINRIKVHTNESHINSDVVCDLDNCGKQFRTSFALNQHKANHICGFNIRGRKATGVCDLENVRKYRQEIALNNQLVYTCKWFGCNQIFENRSIALSHIHNRHICPNRLSAIGPQTSAVPNKNIVQNIIESNRRKANQSFKTNENTIEIIEL